MNRYVCPDCDGLKHELATRCQSCHLKMVRANKILIPGKSYLDDKGYVYVSIPDDSPFVSMRQRHKRHIPEHRLIMAQYLNRPLESCEFVHHKNRNRQDNRIENLKLTTKSENSQLRHISDKLARAKAKEYKITIRKLRKQVKGLKLVIRRLEKKCR